MIQVDTAKFSRSIEALRRVIADDVSGYILKEEAAQLIKTTIRLDNKVVMLARTATETNSQGVRKRAVENAIGRTMRTLHPENARSPKFAKYVKYLNEGGTIEEANTFFRRINKGKLAGAKSVKFDANFHRQNLRRATGTTYLTNLFVTRFMERIRLAAYVKEVEARVGYKFSGFNAAAEFVRLKLPAWVRKHGFGGGSVSVQTGDNQFIYIMNAASKDIKLRYRVQDALRTRSKAMEIKVRRILKGEATNLGFAIVEKSGAITLRQHIQKPENQEQFDATGEQ